MTISGHIHMEITRFFDVLSACLLYIYNLFFALTMSVKVRQSHLIMKQFLVQVKPYYLFWAVLFLLSIEQVAAQSNLPPVFRMPENISQQDYLPGKIIFKMHEQYAQLCKADDIKLEPIREVLQNVKADHLQKMFPKHQPPAQKYHFSGQPYADLSRIYHMQIPDSESLENTINKLYHTGLVEYAVPWYIPQTLYIPDDPFIESQYYLEKIKAFEAWGIEKGDTNIVIAITDTGIDRFHPDLIHSIAYNYDDPINGEDSDNDGYVDNFYGWDFGENNNDPQYNANAHGVHVSGIAGASTDNGTGMAGVGFRSRLLPVKISNADGTLVRTYEGIVYAADQGAQVINCSWGGPIAPGQFGQDIINYAVLNQDAVVVAAAGNNNNQLRFFPASYTNAISVAATNSSDHKWSGSSYGKLVDLSAPGANIFSTWPNGNYISSSGTSMAAPVVSGAAALLRARFPSYNALQIAAQLKVTTDLIDTIPANEPYAGLLGSGRLNMYRALTETYHPYMMFKQLQHPKEYYQLFTPGNTYELAAEFLNLLATANNVTAVLSTQSEHIQIIQNQIFLGTVNHMQTINNFNSPFTFKIKESIPASHEVTFSVRFYHANQIFTGEENFTLTFNLDYIDLFANQISTTVNSHGNIGYNYPNYNQGLGFLYSHANQNRTLIKCAGFIAGNSTSRVADNIYGPMEGSFSNLLHSLENARKQEPPEAGDVHIRGSFNDSPAGIHRVGIKVDYNIYAWQNAPLDKFIILEYEVINESGENLPGFYAGFFADWIIQDIRNHRASFDPANQMGYAYSVAGGNFTGIQLLNHTSIKHYAFDNQGFGGSLRINNGFTSFEKYTALKSNRESAGFFDKDNDISTLVSAGPFNFLPDDTLTFAFALLAGDHINDLQASAQLASMLYSGEYTSIAKEENPLELRAYPNPAKDLLSLSYTLHKPSNAAITIYSMGGTQIYNQTKKHSTPGIQTQTIPIDGWPQGAYILQLRTAEKTQILKFLKQ